MPSALHEVLVAILREHGNLVVALLREQLQVDLPAHNEVRVTNAELSQQSVERRADVVLLLHAPGKAVPVACVIVEVQLHRDAAKRESWPQYLTSAAGQFHCPAYLLVVCPDAGVAKWCAKPIAVGHPGFVLTPLVLGPDAIPVITDAEAAKAQPELSLLSTLAHGNDPQRSRQVLEAFVHSIAPLDSENVSFYTGCVYAALGQAARQELERMLVQGYEYQSDFVRKYIFQGRQEGLQEGMQAGRQEGLQEGMQAGRQEGLQEGVAEGLRLGLAQLLTLRFGALSPAQQAQLSGADQQRLRQWYVRALDAGSVAEHFQCPLMCFWRCNSACCCVFADHKAVSNPCILGNRGACDLV